MTNSDPQFIKDQDGNIVYALVDYVTYKKMSHAVGQLSETENIIKAYAQEDELPELVDAEIIHRLSEGDNPVRVWRENRGLKAIELAKAAGISAAYLSEIETGKKEGTFKTMTSIAAILDIRLDDLAPIKNAADQHDHSQRFRIKAIKAHVGELEKLINSKSSFDTAAVRNMSLRIKSQIEQMDMTNIEEDWLMDTFQKAQHILHLIDEAEENFIQTATTTRDKLTEVFKGYSPDTASRDKSSENSIEDIFSKKRSSSRG